MPTAFASLVALGLPCENSVSGQLTGPLNLSTTAREAHAKSSVDKLVLRRSGCTKISDFLKLHYRFTALLLAFRSKSIRCTAPATGSLILLQGLRHTEA